MKCEKCGQEFTCLNVRTFAYDGTDFPDSCIAQEYSNGAVAIETVQNWTGYGLSEEEQPETITCPHCGLFPFIDTEVQVYDIVRVVMFREGSD